MGKATIDWYKILPQVKQLAAEGMGQVAIGKKLGISQFSVGLCCRQNSIKTDPTRVGRTDYSSDIPQKDPFGIVKIS